MHPVKLTETGKAAAAAISPNGQYVVYVLRDGEMESLMVRQVATGSDVQILPPAVSVFYGLTFSPDGNYIYFVEASKDNQLFSSLYKMPVLGGNPKQVVRDIDTSISFSPDGKQFAFIRGVPDKGVFNLLAANADGSGEKILTSKSGNITSEGLLAPAWSPDGKTIIFASWLPSVSSQLNEFTLATEPYALSMPRTALWAAHIGCRKATRYWSRCATRAEARKASFGKWLILPARRSASPTTSQDYSLPWLDLTADGSAAVSVETTVSLNLWAAPGGDSSRATQITSGGPSIVGVSIMSNDRVLFVNRNREVFTANYDGSDRTLVAARSQHPVRVWLRRRKAHCVFCRARQRLRHLADGC